MFEGKKGKNVGEKDLKSELLYLQPIPISLVLTSISFSKPIWIKVALEKAFITYLH